MMKFATALLAACALASGVPAAAQAQHEDVTVEVRLNGLDLSLSADQQRLDERMDYAIRRACRSDARDAASRRVQRACEESLSDALAPRVELAIANARREYLAAIEANPGA